MLLGGMQMNLKMNLVNKCFAYVGLAIIATGCYGVALQQNQKITIEGQLKFPNGDPQAVFGSQGFEICFSIHGTIKKGKEAMHTSTNPRDYYGENCYPFVTDSTGRYSLNQSIDFRGYKEYWAWEKAQPQKGKLTFEVSSYNFKIQYKEYKHVDGFSGQQWVTTPVTNGVVDAFDLPSDGKPVAPIFPCPTVIV